MRTCNAWCKFNICPLLVQVGQFFPLCTKVPIINQTNPRAKTASRQSTARDICCYYPKSGLPKFITKASQVQKLICDTAQQNTHTTIHQQQLFYYSFASDRETTVLRCSCTHAASQPGLRSGYISIKRKARRLSSTTTITHPGYPKTLRPRWRVAHYQQQLTEHTTIHQLIFRATETTTQRILHRERKYYNITAEQPK